MSLWQGGFFGLCISGKFHRNGDFGDWDGDEFSLGFCESVYWRGDLFSSDVVDEVFIRIGSFLSDKFLREEVGMGWFVSGNPLDFDVLAVEFIGLLWCHYSRDHQKCIAKIGRPIFTLFLIPLVEMILLVL